MAIALDICDPIARMDKYTRVHIQLAAYVISIAHDELITARDSTEIDSPASDAIADLIARIEKIERRLDRIS